VSQLRKKVDELRARLDAEMKRRKIDGNLLQEAKKARDQLGAELRVLRRQAANGATELKKALGLEQTRMQFLQRAPLSVHKFGQSFGQPAVDRAAVNLLEKSPEYLGFSGATRRIRTDDVLITNKLEGPNTRNDPEQSSTKSGKSGG
jgi:hypothetical protein